MQTGQRERERESGGENEDPAAFGITIVYILHSIYWVKMCSVIGRKWTSFAFSFV